MNNKIDCPDIDKTKIAALNALKRLFSQLTRVSRIEFTNSQRVLNEIIRAVLKEGNLLSCLSKVRTFDNYAFDHSMNVCILSLLMGIGLEMSERDLNNLGMAALLHDIGMQHIDKNIVYKTEALNLSEREQVQKHAFLGYEILANMSDIPEEAAVAVWHHHERLDGSGYPQGLVGKQISRLGQIIAVADVFDALISARPFRNALYPHQAVDVLVDSQGQFAPGVLKVFLEMVVLYPINTKVKLNSGDTGIVVDMNKGSHARPVIRIEAVDNGPLKLCKEVDLSKHEDLYIVQVVRNDF